MPEAIHLSLILGAAFVSTASPGPATLMIAGTAMQQGRLYALVTASGILTGSLIWSIAAAMGIGALMLKHVWMLEFLRYAGAAYLLYLAYRSGRSALRRDADVASIVVPVGSMRRTYLRGLTLHLTNPKAILFFGSLYAVGLPTSASPGEISTVIAAIGLQSFLIFHGYALIFSMPSVAKAYSRMRRGFEAAFAVLFGFAGIKVLLSRS